MEELRKEEPRVAPRVLVYGVTGRHRRGADLEIEDDAFPCWMCLV